MGLRFMNVSDTPPTARRTIPQGTSGVAPVWSCVAKYVPSSWTADTQSATTGAGPCQRSHGGMVESPHDRHMLTAAR